MSVESANSFVNPAYSADDTKHLSSSLVTDLVYPDQTQVGPVFLAPEAYSRSHFLAPTGAAIF